MAENTAYCVTEETALLASRAYITNQAPLFRSQLKQRISEDNPASENLQITGFRYLYEDGNLDNLISASVAYQIRLNMPAGFEHTVDLDFRLKCRGFTGIRKQGEPMTVEELESEGQWDPVWIFPESGQRFHSETCTYVRANAREMVLTRELMQQYAACSLCKPASLPIGSFVYCFVDSGSVYHTDSCRQVDKYTIEINREDALQKGYTPCSKCGGG